MAKGSGRQWVGAEGSPSPWAPFPLSWGPFAFSLWKHSCQPSPHHTVPAGAVCLRFPPGNPEF